MTSLSFTALDHRRQDFDTHDEEVHTADHTPEESESRDHPTSGERIAKYLARCGVCSRRDAERYIAAGRVSVDGHALDTPAYFVKKTDRIVVNGTPVISPDTPRLWRYYKPEGLMTTHRDPQGRPTVFDHLPKTMPRVISAGRLDLNSEGLLLLTNDGELARHLEHPSTAMVRRYRVRVYGAVCNEHLLSLAHGITVDGIHYGPITAILEKQTGRNSWVTFSLQEGKNREIRRVMQHLGYHVNRLIRVTYGSFVVGSLKPGDVEEVPAHLVSKIHPQKTKKGEHTTKSRAGWAKPSKPKVRPGYKKFGSHLDAREAERPADKSRTFFRLSETNKVRLERKPRHISKSCDIKSPEHNKHRQTDLPLAPDTRPSWAKKKQETGTHAASRKSVITRQEKNTSSSRRGHR